MLRFWIVAFAIVVFAGCQPSANQWDVRVDAGRVDRLQSVVSFRLPEGARALSGLVLEGPDGALVPVQSSQGRGWFILEDLPADASRQYTLRQGNAESSRIALDAQPQEGFVRFTLDGEAVTTYWSQPTPLPDSAFDPIYQRGGYLYPLYTPNGVLVTDDYPPNHIHHHGIWSAWTRTMFEGRMVDFWNVKDGLGDVRPVGVDTVEAGPVFGRVLARHRYVDLTSGEAKNALAEQWDMRVFAVDGGSTPYRMIELRMRHTTSTDSTLQLPEYHYGGLGFRGHRQWDGENNAFFLTSEGKTRVDGHGTRARWAHMGGLVDGALAGVGLLAHPGNFRSPEPMRIHPTEPFFCWAPSQAGPWAITPDEPYEATYRFVIADGAPSAALLDRLWLDWAEPAVVTVE